MTCPHENFMAVVEINRFTDETNPDLAGLAAEIHAWCTGCDEAVVWHVPDLGMLADRPTVSPDGRELRVPCRVASQPEDFGLQLPGFRITGPTP